MEAEKIDHAIVENHNGSGSDGSPLNRAVTVTLSPEQYERAFFQPSAPRRGDLAKRFANPTLLGLVGFLIPYTSTVLILCQFRGAIPPYSLAGLSGDYYFLGSIAVNIAGIAEFILGNTFPFSVFVIYGCHWGSLAYIQDPIHDVTAAFTAVGGADGAAFNSSQGFHNVTMTIVSFVFLICTFRVNALFTLTFFGLVMLFAFSAAADFAVATATTLADQEHILHLLKFAGGFGMIGAVCGWYLAIVTGCAAVGIPCPLPVFDLSSKMFPKSTDKGV
ncbi:GPR1/FUN34/yaaH family-domain-containing protein [Delphinella strobiligena]|nr:GPR1/FUN34/yaaH family-domain-containing protein [Delphinella strobiligena]